MRWWDVQRVLSVLDRVNHSWPITEAHGTCEKVARDGAGEVIPCLVFVFVLVLVFALRALSLLCKCSTTWAMSQSKTQHFISKAIGICFKVLSRGWRRDCNVWRNLSQQWGRSRRHDIKTGKRTLGGCDSNNWWNGEDWADLKGIW
jgi:hypothetical protein